MPSGITSNLVMFGIAALFNSDRGCRRGGRILFAFSYVVLGARREAGGRPTCITALVE